MICWHCTRLTYDDYISIKEQGLNILTKDMQIDRIKQLDISEDNKKNLIREIEKKDFSTRFGQIHFVFSEKTIDSGCIPFFENWGGESIHDIINKHKEIKKQIIEKSKPYLIKVAIEYSKIESNFIIENMSKRFKDNESDGR